MSQAPADIAMGTATRLRYDAARVRRRDSVERLRHGWFMLLEMGMRVVVNPYLRARLLALCGATVGHNVRIYEMQFLNLDGGFRNLSIEDDVHIGMGCRFDLKGA